MSGFYKGLALLAVLPISLASWRFAGAKNESANDTRAFFSEVTVSLDGMSERPKQTTTTSTGTAKFTWTRTSPISYVIRVKSLSGNPTGAHIHGPSDQEGTAGPVVIFKIDSLIPEGTIATGSIDSTMASIPLDSLKKLMENGRAYVNVHTAKWPNGEIRGQFKAVKN